MPSLKDIRDRIGSVKNTKKITSAMKMVAAAKLRRAQMAVEAARPYANKMQLVIGELASRVDDDAHPLLITPEREENILIILVSSDRGLCGGFNSNLFRQLRRFIADKRQVTSSIKLVTVGRKGFQSFGKSEHLELIKDHEGVMSNVEFDDAKAIAREAMSMFEAGEVDRVYLVFNEFISAININQIIRPLLPFEIEESEEDESANDSGVISEYIYEPSEAELLGQLLPNSVEVQVFQAMLESVAAEQGSRMTAMDNATSNAQDMIDSLTLQYNRARQAYITKELVEIVSGAESLKG